jgi:leucyl-tRNA synthetase
MHATDDENKHHYDAKAIEAKAQAHWHATDAFRAVEDETKPKFYCLSMLPYPSGALHMGHVRNYTIGDVVSRYQRMLGKSVLQPMGFDAFGLPAENAAIKNKVPAASWTYSNIDYMRKQLQALGLAYDWSREVITCKPEYYRFEQELFIKLYEKGLVYRKNSVVNWDPIEQTVLANEQVSPDGRGWRSGALVEKKEIPQWFFKITHYAQELLDGLDTLTGWPDSVKTMQRHWIGRSEGLEIDFALPTGLPLEKLTVYTTRPDTLCGVSFISVAVEHPLAKFAAANNDALRAKLADIGKGSVAEADIEKGEKVGVALGISATHPITGEQVPVWAANFVLMGYGTGAVMAVPGHDQRDWEMARKYGLPIVQVIAPIAGSSDVVDLNQGAYTEYGVCVNSGRYDGLAFQAAFDAMATDLGAKNAAVRKVNFRLRDWGVSRQRYWGCPIPMLYRKDGSSVPVPLDQLPVVLPENVAFSGVKSPIKTDPNFYQYVDPKTGEEFTRETDTFDTFVESSWYYARYCSPGANTMLDERANHWLPIDLYIGGIEHAVMHLLYFRFWHKVMRDVGLVKSDEPATNLLCQGMVVADTYFREEAGGKKEYFAPVDVTIERDAKGRATSAIANSDGKPVQIGAVEKMSKSALNGVDPQSMIDRYGADTVRLFSMFAAPPDQSLEWSESGVEGMQRFVKRVWRMAHEHLDAIKARPLHALDVNSLTPAHKQFRQALHSCIQKVGRDIGERLNFNTAIAAIMEFSNSLSKFTEANSAADALRQESLEAIVKMLAPITPHLCHELWQRLGNASNLLDVGYPNPDAAALVRDTLTLVVQVNGKLRGEIEVAANAAQADIEAAARAEVDKHLQGFSIKKIVVVPKRLVNIVVG